MSTPDERIDTGMDRLWTFLTRMAAAAVLALVGLVFAMWSEVNNTQAQIKVIQAQMEVVQHTRFTDEDGAALERRMKEQIPPTWFRDLVEEVRANQAKILDRLARLEAKRD